MASVVTPGCTAQHSRASGAGRGGMFGLYGWGSKENEPGQCKGDAEPRSLLQPTRLPGPPSRRHPSPSPTQSAPSLCRTAAAALPPLPRQADSSQPACRPVLRAPRPLHLASASRCWAPGAPRPSCNRRNCRPRQHASTHLHQAAGKLQHARRQLPRRPHALHPLRPVNLSNKHSVQGARRR